MRVYELIEQLQKLPQEAYVYLDDHAMPTCLGIAGIESNDNVGFVVDSGEQIVIKTVYLTTYKIEK